MNLTLQLPDSALKHLAELVAAEISNRAPSESEMSPAALSVLGEIRLQLRQNASPWVDRKGAADYCSCSLSKLDEARNTGDVKTYWRGETPMFKKSGEDEEGTLDYWIAHGEAPKSQRQQLVEALA